MTRETQVPAAARDGFVTYDELRGPDLDAARWSPARLPLPTGGEHIPLDPNAELAVGEGEVRATIPRADSPKYLTFSTRQFELPPDRPTTFAVDLAVKNIGGEPGDFRRNGRLPRLRPRRGAGASSPSAAPPPACSRCTGSWAWAVAEQASRSTT